MTMSKLTPTPTNADELIRVIKESLEEIPFSDLGNTVNVFVRSSGIYCSNSTRLVGFEQECPIQIIARAMDKLAEQVSYYTSRFHFVLFPESANKPIVVSQ